MKPTKDAILKLNSGKTIHGIVIEQTIQSETIVIISYKNLKQLGKVGINQLLELIPFVQIKELDYCIK
jgi:hypothetical protein